LKYHVATVRVSVAVRILIQALAGAVLSVIWGGGVVILVKWKPFKKRSKNDWIIDADNIVFIASLERVVQKLKVRSYSTAIYTSHVKTCILSFAV